MLDIHYKTLSSGVPNKNNKEYNMRIYFFLISFGLVLLTSQATYADCGAVTRDSLINALNDVVEGDTYLADADLDGSFTPNGGFDLPMWLVMVDETGKVCHVINSAGSGNAIGGLSWLGSRVIAAQKANTANAFSLDYYSISTANLFGTVQTNNSLFGLQHSNPVNTTHAYRGNPKRYGTNSDPMKNRRVGGVNVFGGGLALYSVNDGSAGAKIGAIGVSGDTSCTDHVIAWKVREALSLNNVPRGPTNANMFNADGTLLNLGGILGDELYMDIVNIGDPAAATGWEHAACPNTPNTSLLHGDAIIGTLP